MPRQSLKKVGVPFGASSHDITYKSDKFGLGFTPGAQIAVRRARARGTPLRISNHGINALEDNDSDCDMDSWIFPTTNGGPSNWTTKEFMPIAFI